MAHEFLMSIEKFLGLGGLPISGLYLPVSKSCKVLSVSS